MRLFNTESLCIQSAIRITKPKRLAIQKDTTLSPLLLCPLPQESPSDGAPSTPLKIQTLNRVSRVKEEK